jgi:hypothetical protein
VITKAHATVDFLAKRLCSPFQELYSGCCTLLHSKLGITADECQPLSQVLLAATDTRPCLV